MESPTAPLDLTLSVLERTNSRSITFRSLVSRKRAYLGPKLPLNTNRKPYVWNPMAALHLTLSDLERSNARSPRFSSLISSKIAYLGCMLLLNINRKPYMGSPVAPLDLTWMTLKGQSQCHPDLRSKSRSPTLQILISRKGARLGHMLLLTINRKLHMASPWHHDIWPWVTLKSRDGQSQGHSDFEALYLVKEPS